MVSVLSLSAVVDRGFVSCTGQIKDNEISMCCFSAKHAALRKNNKDWLSGIRVMCPSGPTCLSADCCSSEQALWNPNNRVGLVQSGPHHHLIEHYYWKKSNHSISPNEQFVIYICPGKNDIMKTSVLYLTNTLICILQR